MALRRRQIDEKAIDDEQRRIEEKRLSAMIDLCEIGAVPPPARCSLISASMPAPAAARCDLCRGRGGALRRHDGCAKTAIGGGAHGPALRRRASRRYPRRRGDRGDHAPAMRAEDLRRRPGQAREQLDRDRPATLRRRCAGGGQRRAWRLLPDAGTARTSCSAADRDRAAGRRACPTGRRTPRSRERAGRRRARGTRALFEHLRRPVRASRAEGSPPTSSSPTAR